CDPGDAVLVPRPGYPLLDTLAELSLVRLVQYPQRWDGERWSLDVAELQRVAAGEPRLKAGFATSPGNPTGAVLSGAARAPVEALCADRDLALVVDEVFRDYPLDPALPGFPSAVGKRSCLCFVLSGLSKVALLPQWKVGWGVSCGPPERVAAA